MGIRALAPLAKIDLKYEVIMLKCEFYSHFLLAIRTHNLHQEWIARVFSIKLTMNSNNSNISIFAVRFVYKKIKAIFWLRKIIQNLFFDR